MISGQEARGVLYNEIEPHAAEWIRNLAGADLVAPGDVDERSIADLGVLDLGGRTQFHTFAGVATWSLALRRAGWPDDCEVWSGSCPCQPFSTAGRGGGTDDERHLWPIWFSHIREHRPPVIFGEQVASPAVIGKSIDSSRGDAGEEVDRAWFSVVQRDLEALGYVVGAAVVPAACVGAPHIRARLYFVAIADGERLEGVRVLLRQRRSQQRVLEVGRSGAPLVMGDPGSAGSGWDAGAVPRAQGEGERGGILAGGLAHEPVLAGPTDFAILTDASTLADTDAHGTARLGGPGASGEPDPHGVAGVPVADANRNDGTGQEPEPHGRPTVEPDRLGAPDGAPRRLPSGSFPGAVRGSWADAEWVWCRDGRYRPVKPGDEPLAHGTTSRVGPDGTVESQSRAKKLAGYGNSIVADVAVTFIEAVIDVLIDE